MSERASWLAVVQNGDDEHEQETELVTIETGDDGQIKSIETTDGRRITLLEPAGESKAA